MVSLLLALVGAQFPGTADPFPWPAAPRWAEAVNPACLAWQPDMTLSVAIPVGEDGFSRPELLRLALPGAGLSGWWDGDDSLRSFTSATAFSSPCGRAAFGASYSWTDPVAGGGGTDRWTAGIALRPSTLWGVGLVYREGFGGGGEEYAAGLALRPAGRRAVVTADASAGSGLDDPSFGGGVEISALRGTTLRADWRDDRITAGLSLDLSHAGASFSGGEDGGGLDRGLLEIRATTLARESFLPPPRRFVRYRPGTAGEEPGRRFLGPLEPSFTDEMVLLARAVGDPSVEGILVELDSGSGTPAQAEEARELLVRAREQGKRVVVYMAGPGSMDYYLASAGTDLLVHPAGSVTLSGLSAHGFYIRGLLDRLGIQPDIVRIGEYKSAADMLLGTGMTPWEREADSTMLHAFHRELFRGVSEGTGLEGAQLLRILELGTVMPEQAVELGMADGTAYPRELDEEVSRIAGHGVRTVELGAWGAERPVEEAWGPRDRIVVIAATGFITSGRSGSMFPLGETMGSESICDLVEGAVSAPGVRALVVRIDSGGGESFASEEMFHSISEAAAEMPVVVSMGAVAASGGYYMACGADSIFADRFTVTGSIGVISGKLAFSRMLAGIGVNYDGIEPYPMSGMYSPFTELTDAQRARMEELNRQSYDLFVGRVAEGRDMTPEEVDSIGRGRVWAGEDALERGLVDRLGGVLEAVECAARMAGLEPGSYAVEVLPRPGLLEGFGLPLGGLAAAGLDDLAGVAGLFDRPLLLASPVVIE